jgi:hypothetical protein
MLREAGATVYCTGRGSRGVGLSQPGAVAYGWGGSETPCFVGRAVAALAGDPRKMNKSGGIYTARELADEYGFTDLDGRRPDHAVLDEAVRKAMESGPPCGAEAKRPARVATHAPRPGRARRLQLEHPSTASETRSV